MPLITSYPKQTTSYFLSGIRSVFWYLNRIFCFPENEVPRYPGTRGPGGIRTQPIKALIGNVLWAEGFDC